MSGPPSRDSQTLIVYQAPWNWDFLWNRAQPMARALSKRCGVVYVDGGLTRGGLFARLPRIRGLSARVLDPAATLIRGGRITQIDESLFRYSWPGSFTEPFAAVYQDWSAVGYAVLRRRIARLASGYERLWLLTCRPNVRRLVDLFPWDRILVDIEDPWLSLESSRAVAPDRVAALLGRADAVFANGPQIASEYARFRQDPIVNLPNGIDDEFLHAMQAPHPCPPPLAPEPGVRTALYTGNINDRISLPEVARVLDAAHGFKFVFVGPTNIHTNQAADWARLIAHPRFRHVPPVPHSDLPSYLQHAEVLLLPYTAFGGTAMFPAKLFEYAAAGKPILTSVDFTQGTIPIPTQRVCGSVGEWVAGLEAASTPVAADIRAASLAVASRQSWTTRIDELLAHVAAAPKPAGRHPHGEPNEEARYRG
ncbi:MAG: glycosyltransferase [Fimbriiglobus sp.]